MLVVDCLSRKAASLRASLFVSPVEERAEAKCAGKRVKERHHLARMPILVFCV